MLDSEMLTRYYTYNAFNYFFYDEGAVGDGVLAGLNANERPKVYEDPYFGMNTIPTLLHWVDLVRTNDAQEAKSI